MNLIFNRGELPKEKDKSKQYWRKFALGIFARHSYIQSVECVRSGRKLDSKHLTRGAKYAPKGIWVAIASTGGRYGKSRRDYLPIEKN